MNYTEEDLFAAFAEGFRTTSWKWNWGSAGDNSTGAEVLEWLQDEFKSRKARGFEDPVTAYAEWDEDLEEDDDEGY